MKPGGGKKERNPKHHSTQTNPVGVGGVCVYVCGMGGCQCEDPVVGCPRRICCSTARGGISGNNNNTFTEEEEAERSIPGVQTRSETGQELSRQEPLQTEHITSQCAPLPPPWYHLLDLFLVCAGAAIWIRLNTPPQPPKTTL